ncbi:hypothetical protein A946_11790 [Methylacidiphilum kamchatkense Kam1]|uniref:Uncharacterized protein n=1 Tax=Methylacidiphilum kamchatkense Kam1 TaxID=1202785 RepID=A0ABR4ZUA1_9BACT|nr:hypothetical protein A946_11790 [Methylacidiphilum kamchatkense Kam1]
MTEGDGVHVYSAHDIPVAFKSTGFASPDPPFGLVAMAAYGTPAGRTSFAPGEARDAVLFRLLFQILDILAVLPLAHTLIVVASSMLAANPVRVSDKKGFDATVLAEVHHRPGAFVAQVADAAFMAQGELRTCPSELAPAPRAFLAVGSLFLDFAQLFAVQPLEGTDASAGYHQRFAGIRDDCGLVDLSKVHRGVFFGGRCGIRRSTSLRYADMQFVVNTIPDDFAGARTFQPRWTRKHQRVTPAPHREHDALLFQTHGLGRPHQRVKAFVLVWIADFPASSFAILTG